MTTISTQQDVVTLINVFTVAPEAQQRLLDLLVKATEFGDERVAWLRVGQPAQEPREDFEAMLQNPEAMMHIGEAARMAERFEPHLYEVSFVDEADRPS